MLYLPFWIIPKQRPDKRPHNNIYIITWWNTTTRNTRLQECNQTKQPTRKKNLSFAFLNMKRPNKTRSTQLYIFSLWLFQIQRKQRKRQKHMQHTHDQEQRNTPIYINIIYHFIKAQYHNIKAKNTQKTAKKPLKC